MVLLIHDFEDDQRQPLTDFTFQYGSINTKSGIVAKDYREALHSNMVLLILWNAQILMLIGFFTFQYGSINTEDTITFSDESFFLYIPIWFY